MAKHGAQVLREVQLRTWEKPLFKDEMLKNTSYITEKFETYLKPLTKDFDKITPWSHHRAELIESTILLWSYLEAPKGMFKAILPAIGSIFDEKNHEGYEEDGTTYIPDKRMKKKILWVTRRGFWYGEKSSGEPGGMTVKAKVIVR